MVLLLESQLGLGNNMVTRKEFYISLFLVLIFFIWWNVEITKVIRKDIQHCEKYNELELRAILNVAMKISSQLDKK